MQIYASTTFLGDSRTDVSEPLEMLSSIELDGIELGSTHTWRPDFTKQISRHWSKPVLTHNYFPPAEHDLVLNIASSDKDVRSQSIQHMKTCLNFANDIGASVYTVHPGFLADSAGAKQNKTIGVYDFEFNSTKTPMGRATNLMNEALKYLRDEAEKTGVKLAVETEGSLTTPGVSLMETPSEFERLFETIPNGIYVNFNIAHSFLAAKGHGFKIEQLIHTLKDRIVAVEISHNDGFRDQHRPLKSDALALSLLPLLPDVPLILEFRCAMLNDVVESAELLRGRNASFVGTAAQQ